ncbi:MAG TPA: transcription elongation factor GreA [Ruminococcaceae bacterium]|nr:transcription elongation factor GreA [Oscillospiraceae bacterium]
MASSNSNRYKMSQERLEELKAELNYMETVREKEVSEQIKEARSFGDLSENSEYDEAKNEQAIIEAKITQLEAMLKVVEVVDTDELSTDVVGVGSKVRILDMDMDEEEEYQIVGSAEADPMENRISDESPMGKGLIGGRVGEEIDIDVPAGIMRLKVLSISK